jgi:ligand-binding SRPBCC domain-containing protein
MKVYTLIRKQVLPVSIERAWDFFSSPGNLRRITPAYMQFRILHISGSEKMYAGQIIRYKLFALPFLPITWTTEITHVQNHLYFVDEQRFGPYTMWHHQHKFRLVPEGVEMIDEVNYALPLGFIGRITHWLFVRRQLNVIFDYRYKVLEELMGKETSIMKLA